MVESALLLPSLRKIWLRDASDLLNMNLQEIRCWDGKNTDSPNHKDHMAYPSTGTFESTGNCPASHPVRTPQVMYEVMWDTREFSEIWPAEGNPLVYATGDGLVIAISFLV